MCRVGACVLFCASRTRRRLASVPRRSNVDRRPHVPTRRRGSTTRLRRGGPRAAPPLARGPGERTTTDGRPERVANGRRTGGGRTEQTNRPYS
ncbi:exported hypothetical protein [Frankia sp. Hr75.2]|nr:exported hypothetical protein [Frankia sp. Hr75.2]